MIDLFTVLLLFSGLFVGLNLGANDAANSFGPTIGAGTLSYKAALILFSVFVILGASVQGFHTINTVGSGVIDSANTSVTALISVLLAVAIMVSVFAFVGIPISTTPAILGGISGVALVYGVKANWDKVFLIFGAGLVTPIIAIFLGYLTYKYLNLSLTKLPFLRYESILSMLLIISSIFLAYSLGANGIGNAMGLVVGNGIVGPFFGGLLGGIALSIGAATFGKRVMKTVSRDIMQLDAMMALSIQFATAVTIYLFTVFGIPTSTTPAMLGSLIGVGLVKGVASLDMGTIKKIGVGWVTSPIIAALLAVMINSILS